MRSESGEGLAYSYVRMSTDVQARGDSYRRQRALSVDYAERKGLVLDDSLDLNDIGKSAYTGENALRGSLKVFLDAVESGKVARGSYLLVESLDRLSRQTVLEAAGLLLSIISAGINIVTLTDERVYGADANFMDLMYALLVLSRAHEESATKSQRLTAVWEKKRQNIKYRKLTAQMPGWLELSGDKTEFLLNPTATATVRLIFEMAHDGMGSYAITRRLNQSSHPTIGRADVWHGSYVTKILSNRAVLGEFQPFRRIEGKRTPVGKPISDYFPRVIDDELFYDVQAARHKRQAGGGGRKGNHLSNLFTHIAKCGYCGAPMRFLNKGAPPKGGQYLRCSASLHRENNCAGGAWPYDHFEEAFLTLVSEVDLASVLAGASHESERMRLEAKTTAITEEIADLKARRDAAFKMSLEGSAAAFVTERIQGMSDDIDEKSEELAALQEELVITIEPSPIEASELKSLIATIRDRSQPDLFQKRSQLSKRLKQIVTRLALMPNGVGIEHADLYPSIRAETKRQAAEAAADLGESPNSQWSFAVALTGIANKFATVDSKDPSKFSTQTTIRREQIEGADHSGTWVVQRGSALKIPADFQPKPIVAKLRTKG